MTLLFVSFIAGVLTVLAPCVLPLLPVVVGSSASGRSRWTPYIVVASLACSIILFTFLLKVSTIFIMVPEIFWTSLSGGILTIFGITLLFPGLWERLPGMAKFSADSNKLLGTGYQRKSAWGDIIIGAALGPIFSTCSPTYFVILASVLPASFLRGTAYLLAYVFGLSIVLLGVAILGQRFADRLTGISDPQSLFKRGVGLLFMVFGILIATGYEANLEKGILNSGFFDVTQVEQSLLQQVPASSTTPATSTVQKSSGVPYKEIVDPSGFVNTDPITIKQFIGKKVILIDFLTYSCINCQRTFPYIDAWYDKYKDQGLEVIGIHTPEFAFEKNIDNVRAAMQRFGITHPIVLDNDYATWNAYGNQYWPRQYLIDIHGNIVYDHAGEGAYDTTEMEIQKLLAERAQVLGAQMPSTTPLAVSSIAPTEVAVQSTETYFGAARNEYLANGQSGVAGEQSFTLPQTFSQNALYLGGSWNIAPEYAESGADSVIVYQYDAKDVYFVASGDPSTEIEVTQDGKPLGSSAGADVTNGITTIKESRLYTIIHNAAPGVHTLQIKVKSGKLQAYTITFG